MAEIFSSKVDQVTSEQYVMTCIDELTHEVLLTPWAVHPPRRCSYPWKPSHIRRMYQTTCLWLRLELLGVGLAFSRYLRFWWSDFDKQGLILKLRGSSIQRFAKFSCREPPDAANSRNFHVVKISCFTVTIKNLLTWCEFEVSNGCSTLSCSNLDSTACLGLDTICDG